MSESTLQQCEGHPHCLVYEQVQLPIAKKGHQFESITALYVTPDTHMCLYCVKFQNHRPSRVNLSLTHRIRIMYCLFPL